MRSGPSILPGQALRLGLALAFTAFGIWALWFAPRPRGLRAFACAFAAVLVLWVLNRPSHDRAWRPDVAVMPRARVAGDRVRITGVRNFAWRTRDDFTPRYETREVSLARLRGVDFFVSYWMPGPIGHTYLERINELADRAEHYHLLSNNCTLNIVRYANAAGRPRRFDIRHYLNGLIDGNLYDSGRIQTRWPFDELRRRSRINATAQAAGDAPNFSERIRASLPSERP